MAIFQFYKVAAVAILDFGNYNFLKVGRFMSVAKIVLLFSYNVRFR